MDVTELFKESVKTVSLRNKELSTHTENFSSSVPLLKRTKFKSAFCIKAEAVVAQIFKLRSFLLENRKAYLNVSKYLSAAPRMTDAERDEIDAGAQKIMVTCSQLIKELRREIAASEVSQQNIEHRELVVLLIEDYLKNVCKIYSEQKAMRIKRTMKIRRMAKLRWDPVDIDNQPVTEIKKSNSSALSKPTDDREGRRDSESSPMKIQEINGDVNTLTYEEELSSEDIQMFESENEQLYNELNTLTEEVKQIESKVVHIAELQEIFTKKVLDQDKDLDRLMTTVVGSTDNVKEANEQIRQAIQRNAGLRVWILFFLLVMSFTLLFLDWYNP